MKIFKLLIVLALGMGAWYYFSTRPVHQSAGILVENDPVQGDITDGSVFSFHDYQITPLASFSVRARVLSVKTYSIGRESDLSTVDVALGWGAMSDSAVVDKLSISQNNRFYFYSWSDQPPLPPQEIVEHSANMHVIPADQEIKKKVSKIHVGDIVEFSGYLIRADAPDGWHWISSCSRTDSGVGACEIVWVEELAIQ